MQHFGPRKQHPTNELAYVHLGQAHLKSTTHIHVPVP